MMLQWSTYHAPTVMVGCDIGRSDRLVASLPTVMYAALHITCTCRSQWWLMKKVCTATASHLLIVEKRLFSIALTAVSFQPADTERGFSSIKLVCLFYWFYFLEKTATSQPHTTGSRGKYRTVPANRYVDRRDDRFVTIGLLHLGLSSILW